MKKLTYEFVKNFFEEHNCTLLAKTYINCGTKMPYICECGNESEITFHNFKANHRCKKCGDAKMAEKRKYTLEEAQEIFKNERCTLLAKECFGFKEKMPYICECGNHSEISIHRLVQGQRCQKCKLRDRKYTLDETKQIFTDGRCNLLAKKYVDARTKMPYICECGNESEITLCSFLRGARCRKCHIKKISDALAYDIEDIKGYFKEYECELLTNEYINSHTKMPYRCTCGEISEITFSNFRKGARCKKCGREKLRKAFAYK